MNTDSLSFAANAVANIVSSLLNKKQYRQQLGDIQKFISEFGFECEKHVYRTLISTLLATGDTNKVALLQQLYADLGPIFARPNFPTLLHFAFKDNSSSGSEYYDQLLRTGPVDDRPGDGLYEVEPGTSGSSGESTDDSANNRQLTGKLLLLVRLLRFTELEKLVVLVTFNELITSEHEVDFEKCQFSPTSELTFYVLSLLNNCADQKANNLAKRVLEELQANSPTDLSSESSFAFLFAPFLDNNVGNMTTSHSPSSASILSEDQITGIFVNESGVQLTSELIRQYNINVTPKLCAKFLFAICDLSSRNDALQTQRGQQEDVEALANICREFLPSASPLADIIQAIDSESFVNSNSKIISYESGVTMSFQKFWLFCKKLCNTDKQGVSILGMMFFGKLWSENIEFQFGFIWNCVKNQLVSKLLSAGPSGPGSGASQELCQVVPQMDSLKCQPDLETNPEISTWKYQKVYQVLIDMCTPSHGASGATLFSKPVLELFTWATTTCPDLLTLGILGCTPGEVQIKKDILVKTIAAFLSNHPNAAIILHTIWSVSEHTNAGPSQNLWARQVLLQAMSDYYSSSVSDEQQQQRLSRILDVAQDLKALSSLFNTTTNYPFVIDLACLTSRREYMKLDKWLTDKIQSNGEPFVNATVHFLNKRCSALLTGARALESGQTPISNLPSETVAVMLSCLHQFVLNSSGSVTSHISKELSETVLTMVANSALLLQKVPRQPPPGVVSGNGGSISQAKPQQPQSTNSAQSVGDLGIGALSLSNQANFNQAAVSRPVFGSGGAVNVLPPPGTPGRTAAVQALAAGSLVANAQGQSERLRQAVSDLSNIFPDMNQNVSPEIEKEADTYFQRIYNQSSAGSMSIDDVLEMLRSFQDSPHSREKEVFTCMIRNLFKEYCFFPQYPSPELLITAQLFGGIIQMGLVKYMALVVALRYVLEALRKPYASKMYYFGIAALDRFKTKLKDYPLYCQHLASIPHFRDFPEHLIDYIEYGGQSQEPPNRQAVGGPQSQSLAIQGGQSNAVVPVLMPNTPQPSLLAFTAPQAPPPKLSTGQPTGASGTRPNSIAHATNIDTLLAAGEGSIQIPPEHIQDKIAFIINNLSMVNLKQKTEEFKDVIGKDDIYDGWIAQYFVMKRASIELNFHTLYANFIDVMKSNEITDLTIQETFRNIKVLLQSDKGVANFSDRSLLKNLGHWLGMLTLAKSKPILAIELNIKHLLIEAYHKGTQELLYVVPFIAKILESCAKSKVFKPPNPWTMGILKALVELHQVPNLKLNLKFEVEVLSKALSQDLSELVGKSECFQDEMLRLRVLAEPQLGGGHRHAVVTAMQSQNLHLQSQQQQQQQQQISLTQPGFNVLPPVREAQPGPSLTGQMVSDGSGFSDFRPSQVSPQPFPGSQAVIPPMIPTQQGAHSFNFHDIQTTSLTGLAAHIRIPSNLPLWQLQPNLKQFVRPAIERAVQEWLQPVVERSIKISIPTAEQIIKKDFALESDEGKMCAAAHYLIRNLTAGMAMITSKETLFVTIATALTNVFSRNCPAIPKDQIEVAANAIASDNIDLACCFIQKSAVEKAIPELDKRLASDYESRRKARAEGRRFCDPGALTYQAERMPEAIRLRVGSVTQQQFAIYEDIGHNIPGFNPVNDPPGSGNQSLNISTGHQNVSGNFPKQGGMNISGMPVVAAPTAAAGFNSEQNAQDSGLVNLYDKLVAELQQLWQHFHQSNQPGLLISTMHNILETVLTARDNPRDIVGALNLIQRVLDALSELLMSMENGMVDVMLISRARDLYLVILKALADQRAYGHQWTTKQITRLVLERLLNQNTQTAPLPDELFDILMRSGLINLPLMDHNLAGLIETSQNPVTLAFTLQFVKIYGQAGLQETEIQNIISSLIKLSKSAGGTSPLTLEIQQILEVFRGPIISEVGQGQGFVLQPPSRPSDFEQSDPPEFMEKTERLLREWIQLYHSTTNLSKVFQVYVQSMNVHGILKTDDSITRFFRLSTELCVEFCYKVLNSNASQNSQAIIETRNKCFQTLDAFAHLIVMLVKHSGTNTQVATESTAKLNLLNKVLNIIAGVAVQDQETRAESFQHLPYYRIFIILFMELTLGPNNLGLPPVSAMQMGFGVNPQMDPLYESVQFQVLSSFCQTLRILRPSKAPSFAYAWLDFISHRTFMEKCLNTSNQMASGGLAKGWTLYAQLLVEIIKFLSPFLQSVELSSAVDLLYKGTLKVLLVLLHDFPEFLCEYCYELCDVIPCNAIQMRNLVLSAFPRNMRLPDPFTPNLKIDSLPEIIQTPKGTTSALSALATVPFKKDLETYLRTRSPVTFLSELRGFLQQQTGPGQQQVGKTQYNIPLMNALVLYVGQQAIQTITPKNINMTTIAHSSQMDIFQNLAVDLDTEGRYLFLNAIANQLRYPNSYTHYFSCTLLYLFAESNTEAIQEQITRVLLERLIVNRPHPWGLLVTFIELIKNQSFNFWNHEFVRCAPEIEKLFESVAKSCMQNQAKQLPPSEGMNSIHKQPVN